MLRWVIAFLLIANLAAFAAVSGAFGPLPSAGDLEPGHVGSQVHPEHLTVQVAGAENPALPASAVVGAPVSTVAPDAASLPATGSPDSTASGAAAAAAPANTLASNATADVTANAASRSAGNAATSTTGASAAAAASATPSASPTAPSSAAQ